jgi:hypothetical protein
MASRKCTKCKIDIQVWADATWHAQITCDAGHVTGLDLCGECKTVLERKVPYCDDIRETDADDGRCGELTRYPEFTVL